MSGIVRTTIVFGMNIMKVSDPMTHHIFIAYSMFTVNKNRFVNFKSICIIE